MNDQKILLVVDTQIDFMLPSGALYVPEAEKLIVPMIDYLSLVRGIYAAVYFTMDWHNREDYARSEEGKQFKPHCMAHTPGSMNVLPIDRLPVRTFVQQKDVFDMWANDEALVNEPSERRMILRDAFWDREWMYLFGYKPEVDVIGVAADYCVKYAVDGLRARGFKVNVIESLTRGINKQWSEVDAPHHHGA